MCSLPWCRCATPGSCRSPDGLPRTADKNIDKQEEAAERFKRVYASYSMLTKEEDTSDEDGSMEEDDFEDAMSFFSQFFGWASARSIQIQGCQPRVAA